MIRQLARIDLHIRRRWWSNYADNPTWSFSRAITAAEALADNQWSFDYAPTLYQVFQGREAWEPNSRWERSPGSPKGGREGKGKGKGKGGKGKGAKGAGRQNFSLKMPSGQVREEQERRMVLSLQRAEQSQEPRRQLPKRRPQMQSPRGNLKGLRR